MINNDQTVKEIEKGLQKTSDEVKRTGIDFFVLETKEIIDKDSAFKEIKTKLENCNNKINNSGKASVEDLFQAYELIMDIRSLILGKSGEISYTLYFTVEFDNKTQMIQTNITRKQFSELIYDKEKENELRLNKGLKLKKSFLENAKALYKKGIDVSYTNDKWIFKNSNIQQQFKDPLKLKQKLEALKKREETKYEKFSVSATKRKVKTDEGEKERTVYKFAFKREELGAKNPKSKTVFSAIGKYAADEAYVKEKTVKEQFEDDKIYNPNIGNLQEIYKLAKKRLNNNHNRLEKDKLYLDGKDLYDIFKQVRGNSDPFYMGGDDLTEQIKSFLGSMPSLSDVNVIKKIMKNFNDIFKNAKQFDKNIRTLFEQSFIKKKTKLNQDEKKLAEILTKELDNFFVKKIKFK